MTTAGSPQLEARVGPSDTGSVMNAEHLAPETLPAQRGGAKAFMLTILGEFVLPRGGSAWTSTLVAAADALGIGEKNARQAIARIGDQGLVESERHGRTVRWSLTGAGRRLLESGTERIYGFGVEPVAWSGEWLVAHCPVAESQRSVRNRLRSELGFLGFGELSPSLLISPHVERGGEVAQLLDELELTRESTLLRSNALPLTGEGRAGADAGIVAQAWPLDDLAAAYARFIETHDRAHATEDESAFRAIVELVHDWRRFPFADPELPSELLPGEWVGARAVELFHRRHGEWSAAAQRWFAGQDDAA